MKKFSNPTLASQLPLQEAYVPSIGDHKALNKGTLRGLWAFKSLWDLPVVSRAGRQVGLTVKRSRSTLSGIYVYIYIWSILLAGQKDMLLM